MFGHKVSYRDLIPDQLDRDFFLTDLQKEAIDQTLEFFKRSGSAKAISFCDAILNRSNRSGLGFTLTESGEAMEDRPAGYVRAQGHIIMNFSIMTRDDWLFLFIHEFSHYTDSHLETAVQSAILLFKDDPQFVFHLLESIKDMRSLSELSQDQNTRIDQYLGLSLERGWIAEIRAWQTPSKFTQA